MGPRLSAEEIVTLGVLSEKRVSNCAIARQLGVTEGTVRYHLRRKGAPDGRANKVFKAEELSGVIEHWRQWRSDLSRPINVQELHEHLLQEYGYEGSYRSVLRYVRRRWGRPPIRTWRRVETPPGAQTQTDWGEFRGVDIGNGPQPLSVLVMVLSHSRKTAAVWSEHKDLMSWLHCHNEAYRRLDGVAAVNRLDNVKTAIVKGAGAWGVIHPTYRAYARSVRFHIDACAPRSPQAKGKVESKVASVRRAADPCGRRFADLEELQRWTDLRLQRASERLLCPATGQTIHDAWRAELERLAPLPELPEPFDVVVTRTVYRDCRVPFEGRSYPVPFQLVGQEVEVRGCAATVQILAAGEVVRFYPRRGDRLIELDASCYEGEATDRVLPPMPLGKMGRRLQEIMEMPVEARPIDLYAALAEVAR